MTRSLRIQEHPILPSLDEPCVHFTFNGHPLVARSNEVISSALYAAGVSTFGHHHRDGGAQGIFCVNGQCSQCTVLVNGTPLKACMTPVQEGMCVESLEGMPSLPEDSVVPQLGRPKEVRTQVVILGGGAGWFVCRH